MTVNELRRYLAEEVTRCAISHPHKADLYRGVVKLIDAAQYELETYAEEDSDDPSEHERHLAARAVLKLMAGLSA